jgi:hypothetical protein
MKTQTQTHSPINATKSPVFTPVHGGLLQRKCACGNHTVAGGECAECTKNKSGLQRKLAIGASNDPLEREADRVADQVMAAPTHSAVSRIPPSIQRYAGQATEGSDTTVPASVDRVLASSGRPLESRLRQDMEQRFGHDFSRVRVHSGGAAEQSARDVSANAYTAGHNIVFGAGRFSPESHEGRRLIAHELTHVVQQSGVGGVRVERSNETIDLSPVSSVLPLSGRGDPLLQRQSKPSEEEPFSPGYPAPPKKFSGGSTRDFQGLTLELDSNGCPPMADCGLGLKVRKIAHGCITGDCPPILGNSMLWKICSYETDGLFYAYHYALFANKNDTKPSFSIGPLCLREQIKPERQGVEPPLPSTMPEGVAIA